MYIQIVREPRNEELIGKVAQTKGNYEAFDALWDNREYSKEAVLESLLYAAEDGLIAMDVRDRHLVEWLYEDLCEWVPEYFPYWVEDISGTETTDFESKN